MRSSHVRGDIVSIARICGRANAAISYCSEDGHQYYYRMRGTGGIRRRLDGGNGHPTGVESSKLDHRKLLQHQGTVMNGNYRIISVEQLDTMLTSVWELTDSIDELKKILNPHIVDELIRTRDQMSHLLKEIRDQHKDEFDRKIDYFTEVAKSEGFTSEWSMFEVDDLDAEHPYKAAKSVTYDNHWGSDVVVKEIHGVTWKDLYSAADACIRASKDTYHRGIVGFYDRGHTLVLVTVS